MVPEIQTGLSCVQFGLKTEQFVTHVLRMFALINNIFVFDYRLQSVVSLMFTFIAVADHDPRALRQSF